MQLAGLTLTPAQDSGEDLTLTITATAHDSLPASKPTHHAIAAPSSM